MKRVYVGESARRKLVSPAPGNFLVPVGAQTAVPPPLPLFFVSIDSKEVKERGRVTAESKGVEHHVS